MCVYNNKNLNCVRSSFTSFSSLSSLHVVILPTSHCHLPQHLPTFLSPPLPFISSSLHPSYIPSSSIYPLPTCLYSIHPLPTTPRTTTHYSPPYFPHPLFLRISLHSPLLSIISSSSHIPILFPTPPSPTYPPPQPNTH